jgi:hypothetical protein
MQTKRRQWPFRVIPLGLALVLMGCATGAPILNEVSTADQRHMKLGFSSPDPNHWNSTDLTLWMTMNGGG